MEQYNIKEYSFKGQHVLVELSRIPDKNIDNLQLYLKAIDEGIKLSNTHSQGTLLKKFEPQGLTILILLTESHIAVHTYPEHNALFLDVFTCGLSCRPELIVDAFINNLEPGEVKKAIYYRGWQY